MLFQLWEIRKNKLKTFPKFGKLVTLKEAMMLSREEMLKRAIEERFGSIKKFCDESGIPKSTVYNVFSRGVENTRTHTLDIIYAAIKLDDERDLFAPDLDRIRDDTLTKAERRLVQLYRESSDFGKKRIVDIAETICSSFPEDEHE